MTTETVRAPEAPASDATPAAWRARVDDRLARLEADLAAVNAQLPHLATKADVERAINALTWRLILGLAAGLTALAAFLKLTGS